MNEIVTNLTITLEGPAVKWVFHHIADAVDFCDEPHEGVVIERVTATKGDGGKVEERKPASNDWKEIKKAVKIVAAKALRN